MNQISITDQITTITNVRVFDGECVLNKLTVTIKGKKVINVGGPAPAGAEIIDGKGCTLLPGLIDAHSHPKMETLNFSLTFGVTTTYQMQGYRPKEIIERTRQHNPTVSIENLATKEFEYPAGSHHVKSFST